MASDFEERAQAEAFQRIPWDPTTAIRGDDRARLAFIAGAKWAAEQETSDAEVEAAARKVWRWFVGGSLWDFDRHAYAYDREKCIDAARAALLAARDVRLGGDHD